MAVMMAHLVEHVLRAETERWLSVVGWEGYYEVSNRGRVRSLPRTIPTSRGPRPIHGKLLTPHLNREGAAGRWAVIFARDGRYYNRFIHTVMLEAFVGPRPPGFDGCHNDGDRDNNTIGNLRWDTKSNNALDRVRHGNHFQVDKTHCPQGHPYDDENTIVFKGTRRRCRTCAQDAGYRYFKKHKSKDHGARPCHACGRMFESQMPPHRTRFCSKDCKRVSRRKGFVPKVVAA